MCRLAAWLGESTVLENVIVKPAHSLVTQSLHANEAKLAVNGDGFGFAWYDERGKVGVYKDVQPAWSDSNLPSLTSMIQSPLFMAHVRASTYGEVSRSNCHPFTYGCWSFIHNGQIGDFSSHKRKLENDLPDALYSQRTGNTDSEVLFLMLVANGLEADPLSACRRTIKQLENRVGKTKKPTRIAALISNGKELFALRYSSDTRSPTLYVNRSENGNTILASEPLQAMDDDWRLIKESALTVITPANIRHYALT